MVAMDSLQLSFELPILRATQTSNYTWFQSLLLLSDTTRHIFFGVFLVLSIASLIGNLAAIYSISKRKYRYIQKTCIISLALADILSTVSIGLNNLETFSHPLIEWTMGGFLCSLIPLCQFWGMTASSLALVVIALDRYRNVVHALSKRWNPKLSTCLLCATGIWVTSLAFSFPMYTFFKHSPIGIVFPGDPYPTIENSYLCISFQKEEMKTFYIVMFFIIFLPLFIIFIWFYYKIAVLIWKHRKPLSTIFNKTHNISESTSNNNTKTTELTSQSTSSEIKSFNVKGTKDVRVERKIRTFKIILTLMIIFLICRLPSHIFTLLKLNIVVKGEGAWIGNYVCISLGIVNCVLNPLLYTFLNQTIHTFVKVKKAINDFTCGICCCCCSNAEFEDYEKGTFVVENFDRKKSIKDPLKSNRSSRIKFEDVQEVQMSSNSTDSSRVGLVRY